MRAIDTEITLMQPLSPALLKARQATVTVPYGGAGYGYTLKYYQGRLMNLTPAERDAMQAEANAALEASKSADTPDALNTYYAGFLAEYVASCDMPNDDGTGLYPFDAASLVTLEPALLDAFAGAIWLDLSTPKASAQS